MQRNPSLINELELISHSLENLIAIESTDSSNKGVVLSHLQKGITLESETIKETITRLFSAVYDTVMRFINYVRAKSSGAISFIVGKERILREMNQKQLGIEQQVRHKLRKAILPSDIAKALTNILNGKPSLVPEDNTYTINSSDKSVRFYPVSISLNESFMNRDGKSMKSTAYYQALIKDMDELSNMEKGYAHVATIAKEITALRTSALDDVVKGKPVERGLLKIEHERLSDKLIHNLTPIPNTNNLHDNRVVVKVSPEAFLTKEAQALIDKTIKVIADGKNLYRLESTVKTTTDQIKKDYDAILKKVSQHPTPEVKAISSTFMLNNTVVFKLLKEYQAEIINISSASMGGSIAVIRARGKVYSEILRYLDKRGTKYRN